MDSKPDRLGPGGVEANVKPTTAAGYLADSQLGLIKATCLYVATVLGDLMDELVVVGGLVPSLLVGQEELPPGVEPHVGTTDLNVGLTLTLLDDGLYRTLADRLRRAGFEPDRNEAGLLTRQRWVVCGVGRVTVDFLIPPSGPEDRGGRLRNIEGDFAALIAPGLDLAFSDRQQIVLSGSTILGEQATRTVWVCGPGAFVVLKALAFENRGENKDAYDLFYILRSYGAGVESVAAHLAPLRDAATAEHALEILRRDFLALDGLGPRRVAAFLSGGPDDEIQADVVGFVRELLDRCK